MKKSLKGMLKSLEAILAASIILMGLAVLLVAQPKDITGDIRQEAYSSLNYLDNSGILRQYAETENTQAIEKELKNTISYSYKVVFCRNVCDSSNIPTDKTVVLVDYYIAGYPSKDDIKIDPKKLRLYIWE